MKKQIILPANGIGVAIMLIALVLTAVVPFVVALWLVQIVAPWWVAVPVAIAASAWTVAVCVTVDKELKGKR